MILPFNLTMDSAVQHGAKVFVPPIWFIIESYISAAQKSFFIDCFSRLVVCIAKVDLFLQQHPEYTACAPSPVEPFSRNHFQIRR